MNILQIKWSFNQMLIAVEPYDERKKIEKKKQKSVQKIYFPEKFGKEIINSFFFYFWLRMIMQRLDFKVFDSYWIIALFRFLRVK